MTETPHTPLEPCPFCGYDSSIVIIEDRVWVECADCSSNVVVGPFDTEAEAIAAWNARHPTSLPTTANNPETDAHGEMLAALKWIAANYENGMINHVDFRVEAKFRADVALTKAEVTHG